MKTRFKAVRLRQKLAENIRKAATRESWGINALADTAGVSRSQLYDVLKGTKGATVDFMAKVARPLRLEVHQLLR